MPTTEDRQELAKAIEDKKISKIRELLQRDDAKELLLMKYGQGWLPIHDACYTKVDRASLHFILDAAVEHGIIKKMLETKETKGQTCFHIACYWNLSFDSLRLLLEYSSKYADMRKILEEKDNNDWTHLHNACFNDLPIDSLRLLISFFPSKETFANVLGAKNQRGDTPVDRVEKDEIKQLLQDRDCWQKCRLWILRNHETTFICSLFPTSFDKTCQTLLELNNGLSHSQQHATIILIALTSSPVKFRQAVDKTDSSAPMASYFDVVKKGDEKSTYNHWRKNIHLFREFYGQWPPSDRKTKTSFEGADSSSCVIQ